MAGHMVVSFLAFEEEEEFLFALCLVRLCNNVHVYTNTR